MKTTDFKCKRVKGKPCKHWKGTRQRGHCSYFGLSIRDDKDDDGYCTKFQKPDKPIFSKSQMNKLDQAFNDMLETSPN